MRSANGKPIRPAIPVRVHGFHESLAVLPVLDVGTGPGGVKGTLDFGRVEGFVDVDVGAEGGDGLSSGLRLWHSQCAGGEEEGEDGGEMHGVWWLMVVVE